VKLIFYSFILHINLILKYLVLINFTFINVNLGADLKDCIMDAARSLDRWTRLLLQVSADSAVIDGAGIFNS